MGAEDTNACKKDCLSGKYSTCNKEKEDVTVLEGNTADINISEIGEDYLDSSYIITIDDGWEADSVYWLVDTLVVIPEWKEYPNQWYIERIKEVRIVDTIRTVQVGCPDYDGGIWHCAVYHTGPDTTWNIAYDTIWAEKSVYYLEPWEEKAFRLIKELIGMRK
jgi:hypothetical protein